MAINGPSMGIDEVFLTLIPSMGHRWTIDEPSMEIEIFHHKNSFGLAMFKIFNKNMRWAIIQIPSMAIDGPSMPIGKSCDGHRWPIDGPSMAHRWASTGPSMGLNGVSVRVITCFFREDVKRKMHFPLLYANFVQVSSLCGYTYQHCRQRSKKEEFRYLLHVLERAMKV